MPATRFAPAAALILACALSVSPVHAFGFPEPPAASSPADGPSLDARLEWLAQRLDRARAQEHIPGLAIAVVRDGKVIFERGFGVANVGTGAPVTPETIFGIGSQTKAFTSMLCAMLVADGKMSFDDPVVKHMPAFALKDPERTAQVTIRDALSHRTGLQRTDLLWANGRVPRARAIEQLRHAEPFAPFRTAFLYSNLMFMVAGDVAATVAGAESWEALVKQRIFTPLGMSSTTARTSEAQDDPRRALGYQWEEGTSSWRELPMRVMDACGPAGSINSNVRDMSRWVAALLNNAEFEGARLLADPALLRSELWKPQNPIGDGSSYGLGWMLATWRGRTIVHHGGNIDGYACMLALAPDDNLGFVLLHNTTMSALQDASRDLVFKALLGGPDDFSETPPANALTEEQLRPYLGRYKFIGDQELQAVIRDGKLALDIPGQTVYALKWPNEQGRWVFELTDAIEVSFTKSDDGSVSSITMYQAGMEIPMPRVTGAPKYEIEPAKLSELVRSRLRGEVPQTLRATGTLEWVHQGISGTVTMVMSGNAHATVLDMGDFGRIATGYDGTHAWIDSDLDAPRVLAGREAALARAQSPRVYFEDPLAFYETVEPVGKDSVRGRQCYRVRLTPKGGGPVVTTWFDAETGRPLKEEQPMLANGHEMPGGSEIAYSGWERSGPIDFPTRISLKNNFQGTLRITIDSVELDANVEPAEVAMPAHIKP